MCRRVTCPKCKKFTYAGCGNHIQEALKGLTKDQICQCKTDNKKESKSVVKKDDKSDKKN